MKKLLLAGVALVADVPQSASAADIQRRQAMPAKAPRTIYHRHITGPAFTSVSMAVALGVVPISPTPFAAGSFKTSGWLLAARSVTTGRWAGCLWSGRRHRLEVTSDGSAICGATSEFFAKPKTIGLARCAAD